MNKVVCGDCRNILGMIPDETIQTVITSIPYYGLRDYGLEATIWDEKSGCEHQWGKPGKGFHVGQIPDGKWTKNDSVSKAANLASGQFCTECNAWKGVLGLEPSPELYVKHIVDIFRQIWRVLRKDGTVWLNIGDSYWGGKGQSGTRGAANQEGRNQRGESINKGYQTLGGAKETKPTDGRHPVLKPKDLCMIPYRLAIALQENGWWIRSDIIWAKSSAMPESVNDRPTKSHEYVFLMAKSGKAQFWTHRELPGTRKKPKPDYRWWDNKEQVELDVPPEGWKDVKFTPTAEEWERIQGEFQELEEEDQEEQMEMFHVKHSDSEDEIPEMRRYKRYDLWRGHSYYFDAEAIKEPMSEATKQRDQYGFSGAFKGQFSGTPNEKRWQNGRPIENPSFFKPGGRNKRSVWNVNSTPYRGAHFAVFPPALIRPMIMAGSSDKACPHCGAPWMRIMAPATNWEHRKACGAISGYREAENVHTKAAAKSNAMHVGTGMKTCIGFRPTCDCEENDGSGASIVLDAFAGSGTTAQESILLGREYIAIEAQSEYIPMIGERVAKAKEEVELKAKQPTLWEVIEGE